MNDIEYSKMQGVRRSDLWQMKKSAAHYKYHIDNPEEPTPALIFGQAYHKYVLEPETFFEEFYVLPEVNKRTKEGRAIVEALQAENKGKTAIDGETFTTIQDMRTALENSPETAPYIDAIRSGKARTEVPFVWEDDETGEVCKCKADMIIDETAEIIDLKSTLSCEDGAFERSANKFGYNYQAGFYTEGIDKCTSEKHTFKFIAQEKNAPYVPRVYTAEEGFIEEGRMLFHTFLRRLHKCNVTGEWPGYEEMPLIGGGY